MKLRTADNKEVSVIIYYNANRYDSYTILYGTDVYGCTPDAKTLYGYAGNLIQAGYSKDEYVQWCQDNTRKVGYKVQHVDDIPHDVIEYVHQIINSEI